MAITAYTSKYYDDINTPDTAGLTPLDKNYLRILFQPGRTVQARELNQAQSILQAQLDRLGSSLFKPNSAIIGGDTTFDNTLSFIDVTFETTADGDAFAKLLADTTGVSVTSDDTITAALVKGELLNSLTYRLYIQYRQANSTGTINEITGGVVAIEDTLENVINATVINNGNAVSLFLPNGIFFVKGCLASVTEQFICRPLAEDELFDGYAVLKVGENQVTSGADSTLFDNANGHPNFAAPGADRYQITLTLDLVENFEDDNNFVVLLEIKDNEVIFVENAIDNSNTTLEKILAQRTFEESGSYVVDNFGIEIQEVLSSGSYTGRYKNSTAANNLSQSDADKKFAATISPSIAYVRGRRVDLESPLTLLGDKARVSVADLRSGVLEDGSAVANMGNYVEGQLRNVDNFASPLASPETDSSPESGYGTGNGEGLPFFDNYSRTYNLLDASDATIGTCKILSVELIDGAKHRLFLHDISLNTGKKFDNVETIRGTAVADYGALHFSVESRNGVKLHDTEINSTLFPLPQNAVRKFNNIQVTERVNLSADMPVASGNEVTFDLTGVTFDKSPSAVTVYNATADKVLLPTEFTVVSSADTDSLTLDIPTAEDGDVISIIATATLNLTNIGIKTETTEEITLNNSPLPAVGDIVELPGVFHLISVEDDNFELVSDGQKSTEYELAKVRCLKAPANEAASKVNVKHWKFSGGNYYTVNSYRNSAGGQSDLDDIPSYNGQRLGDFFDIRPYPNTTDILALDPYSAITGKIDYFLPRIDSVTILQNGDFSIEKGTPSLTPVPPNNSANGLVLFNLTIPAYTYKATNIGIEKFNHRRYTMRDIGKIDTRVSNLEYYTTLSLLEKSANDKSIFDDDGTARFKNGLVVDGFRNFTIGNALSKDFVCHYERERGHLYPAFKGYSVPFELISTDGIDIDADSEFSESGLHNEVLTLPYNEVAYITQPYATQFMSVQPYEYVSTLGSMILAPEVDTWNDTITAPEIDFDIFGGTGLFDTLRDLTERVNEVQQRTDTQFAGGWRNVGMTRRAFGAGRRFLGLQVEQERVITETEIAQERVEQALGEFVTDVKIRPYARSKALYFRAEGLKPSSKFYFFIDGIDVTSNAHLLTQSEIVNSHEHTETAVLTDQIEGEVKKFLTNNLTVPTWFGTRWYNLKASDRSFATNVANQNLSLKYWNYVKTILDTINATTDSDEEKTRQINALLPGFDQSSLAQYDGADEETLLAAFPTSDIISDADGVAEGIFIIPNNDTLRFSSGEKTVTITNSPRNLEEESTSNASARFISNGLEINKQAVNISATLPRITTTTRTERRTRVWDPIAQTFTVTDDTGIFATSMDLFFAGKPNQNTKVPVQIYIVTTVNGYPTGEVVPGSQTTVNWEDVVTSTDGSLATRFEFKHPIHLAADTEYATVCFSTSPDYTAYIAEQGGDKTDLITGHIITSQPALGSLFTSSNKSTWTPNQTKDLKFTLRRGSFATNQTAQFVANPQVGSHLGEIDASTISNNTGWDALTCTVTVEAPFTTVIDSDGNSTKVAFPGGVTATAVPVFDPADSSITKINLVRKGFGYLEAPTVTISDGSSKTAETITGSLNRYNVGAFALNQKSINLGGKTSTRNEVFFEDTKYDVEAGLPVEYITNQNHNITAANIDKTRLQTFFSSTDERLTPVINRDLSLETREYFINETGDTSQYITREITLDNLSDQIDVYLDINRPSSTSHIEVFAQLRDINNAIISSTETDTDFHTLSPINPTAIPINVNRGTFNEVRFNLNTEPVEFSSFIIKIVMRGEYYGDAPFSKDLRVIATV